MCRLPVTLGGGMVMLYLGLPGVGSAWKYPAASPFGVQPRLHVFGFVGFFHLSVLSVRDANAPAS